METVLPTDCWIGQQRNCWGSHQKGMGGGFGFVMVAVVFKLGNYSDVADNRSHAGKRGKKRQPRTE